MCFVQTISILIVILLICFSVLLEYQLVKTESFFVVKIRLFGVGNTTGNVLFFSTVNNVTKASIINASAKDLTDYSPGDKTIENTYLFPNTVVKNGNKIQACIMMLLKAEPICSVVTHRSATSQDESVGLFLNSSKSQPLHKVQIWRSIS